jgi:hypothetical protein
MLQLLSQLGQLRSEIDEDRNIERAMTEMANVEIDKIGIAEFARRTNSNSSKFEKEPGWEAEDECSADCEYAGLFHGTTKAKPQMRSFSAAVRCSSFRKLSRACRGVANNLNLLLLSEA